LSEKHPIIVITGSSGAGTSTVRATFEEILRREGVTCAIVEGDAFHRYDRLEMKEKMAEMQRQGHAHFSHFGPEANFFEELERGVDFPYLLSMLEDSFMSRANTIVCPGGKMPLAMQLIFTPMIWKLIDRRRRIMAK